MTLTIAIPTIPSRAEKFSDLKAHINRQTTRDVEVIAMCDDKTMSIGRKRQAFLEAAQGDYITMIDDDDWVPTDFVPAILKAITIKPDSVGFQIECTGTSGKRADVSNRYQDWGDNQGGFDYVRTPYHKTPIRTEIARKIGFPDLRFGEDYDFSRRLKTSGLIQTEVYLPRVMYHYRFSYEDPKIKYGYER